RGRGKSRKLVERKREGQEVGGEEEGRTGWWGGRGKSRKLVERKREEQEVGGEEEGRAGSW
ncbi:uncharacterized, partial [Tachysurus ichikawai]